MYAECSDRRVECNGLQTAAEFQLKAEAVTEIFANISEGVANRIIRDNMKPTYVIT
jgi:hypothetical protein